MSGCTLSPMEYVRAALANAEAEGLTLLDVYLMAEHAHTTADFDDAVNELIQASGTHEADLRDQHRDLFPK